MNFNFIFGNPQFPICLAVIYYYKQVLGYSLLS